MRLFDRVIEEIGLRAARFNLIKAAPDMSVDALLMILTQRLKDAGDEMLKEMLRRAIEALRDGKDIAEAVAYLKEWSAGLPDAARAALGGSVLDLTEKIYAAGLASGAATASLRDLGAALGGGAATAGIGGAATAGIGGAAIAPLPASVGLSLSLADQRAIEIIGRQNLFWIGEHYNKEVKDRFDRLLTECFQEGLSRLKFAERLKDAFGPWTQQEASYWEGLADHISMKTREMGRVSAYEEMGVEYAKVVAILDERTSRICRSMNGRLIPVAKMRSQLNSTMSANSREEILAAWGWLEDFHGKTSNLPSNVAMPPYHYRCRTTTVAYLGKTSNVGRTYQYFDGQERRKETIAANYVDQKIGREFVVTEDRVKHIIEGHPEMTPDKIMAALRNITKVGENINQPGQIMTQSQNGVVLVFRDNAVFTGYIPDYKGYFNDNTVGRFNKWIEAIKSIFAQA
jgi:hypothetical protein